MSQISLYQAPGINILKNLAALIEKCYNSDLNAVLVLDEEKIEEVDKYLWIYARRGFLPHGTNKDEYPERQPVYITDKVENPNNAEVLILLNPTSLDLASSFKKTLIVCDITLAPDVQNMLDIAGASYISYIQNPNGSWIKS